MKTESYVPTQFRNACLGNLFEHYDTALFGFLSSFLAPLLFPNHDPTTALILTYALIPLTMLARPFGSLFFGYIGDIYGRERALFLTLTGMAIVSGCIGFTPTYAAIGIFSTILFTLGRTLQNFFAAGETMGGAIFILEHSSEKRHDLLSGFYSASAMGGHLLASFGVFFLSQYDAINSGWRWLYIFGCITALFGCLIRYPSRRIQKPTLVAGYNKSLIKLLWTHRQSLLIIITATGFAHATYCIALIFMNGFVPLISDITKPEIMKINSYLLILDFCSLPFFGWVASKVSREKVMLGASLSASLLSIPLFSSLEGASYIGVVIVRVAFVIFGVAFFAPFHAWAQQLVPSNSRYTVISLGYAIGSQLFGAPTAALALWCYQKTGMISSVAWYWMALGLASTVSIIVTMRGKDKVRNFAQ